jgi:citrate lyase subunit beta/citryl-CoA lyase
MRSLLFLPGNRDKFLEKAAALNADGLIIDFEDSVPSGEKTAARNCLAAHAPLLRHKSLWIRPNAFDTPHFDDDLAAICSTPGVAGLMLPKAEDVASLRAIDDVIGAQERAAGLSTGTLKLILIIESARGVMRSFDLATASTRIVSLCFGGARDGDLMADLRCEWSHRGTLQHAREQVLIAARAAGCRTPLDGVFVDVRDQAGFEQDTRVSRALGYHGRTVIHPSQIDAANRLYSPTAEEISESRRLIEAFEQAEARGHASVLFEGRMIDVAMARAARNVIDGAEPQSAQ